MMEEGATFCVSCGSTEPPFVGAVCVPCFSKRTPLATLPRYLDVTLCPVCGSREVGNHWEKARGAHPEEVQQRDLLPHVTVAPPAEFVMMRWNASGQNPRLREVDAIIKVKMEGRHLEVSARTEVHLVLHACPDCSRRGGNYFTSRIQLRTAEEGVPRDARDFKPWALEVWLRHLKSCSPQVRESVTKEEELKEGWDIFFADTNHARSSARSFKERTGASARETASLWGMKKGKEIHRVTFLVRLPPVLPGDFVEDQGRLWEVVSPVERGEVELSDVLEGTRRRLDMAALSRTRFVAGAKAREELPLVRPPAGAPFARVEGSDEARVLRGTPPPAGDPGVVKEGRDEPRWPLVLGRNEAWWAPRAGPRDRGEKRESNR
jgi:NMD protein affecting ribosome stability and mRNA decay